MSTQHDLVSVDHTVRDLYARERVLNSAIIGGDIGRGWEEYLEKVGFTMSIFDRGRRSIWRRFSWMALFETICGSDAETGCRDFCRETH